MQGASTQKERNLKVCGLLLCDHGPFISNMEMLNLDLDNTCRAV